MIFKNDSIRIFFSSDIHGSEVCFRKFLNAAKFYNANALIFGGDITGKALVPILKENGSYKSVSYGNEIKINSEQELQNFIKLQKDKGFYPIMLSKEEYEELKSNKRKLDELFKQEIISRIESWVKLAVERLQSTGVKLYWEAGNDDFPELDNYMSSDYTILINERMVDLFDFKLAGLSYANMTPWKAPRDIEDDKLLTMATEVLKKNGFSESEKLQELILAYHPPPYDTILDLAPKLNEDFTYARAGGQPDFIHVGSKSVRYIEENYKPVLALHGHIHESKGVDKVGSTVAINPGSEYSEGVLHGALVNISKKGVKSYILTTG